MKKQTNSILENDLELFIGFTDCEGLKGDISENNYYKLPLKGWINIRLNEEKNKFNIKRVKRFCIYPKDNHDDKFDKNDIKKYKKKYPK